MPIDPEGEGFSWTACGLALDAPATMAGAPPPTSKRRSRGQREGLPARNLPLGCHHDPRMELLAFLVRGRGGFQSVQARIDSGTVAF